MPFPKGGHHTAEAKARMSVANLGNQNGLGRKHSPETLDKISAASLGRKHSTETRAKMSVAAMGNKHALGHELSPEARAKLSAESMGNQRCLGREVSQETRAKISAANLGHKLSPETRAKMSAARVGNQNALGNRSNLGKKASTETRAKISIAVRGTNYRTGGPYCASVYENAWGQIPEQDSGRAYNIHHRDGNRENDDPENLIALTNTEHMTLENALRREDFDLAAEIDAVGVERRKPGGGNGMVCQE